MSYEKPGQFYIRAYDLQGVKQGQWGRRGAERAEELKLPLLCGSDSSGSVLVADSSNKLFKVLRPDGQFDLLFKAYIKGLYIWDVIFVKNNKIYVLYRSL